MEKESTTTLVATTANSTNGRNHNRASRRLVLVVFAVLLFSVLNYDSLAKRRRLEQRFLGVAMSDSSAGSSGGSSRWIPAAWMTTTVKEENEEAVAHTDGSTGSTTTRSTHIRADAYRNLTRIRRREQALNRTIAELATKEKALEAQEAVWQKKARQRKKLLDEVKDRETELQEQEESLQRTIRQQKANRLAQEQLLNELAQKEQDIQKQEKALRRKESQLLRGHHQLDQKSPAEKYGHQHKQQDHGHVSACVMIMDDNHALIEWLAFHYHTLPLRRLIVLVDPYALTTPEPILQRWKGLINITLWNDQDVFPGGPPTRDTKAKEYVYRQQKFHAKCMHTLMDEGHHRWMTLFDPDEYITINERVWNNTDRMYGLNLTSDTIEVPSPREAGSTLTFIQRAIAHVHRYGIRNNPYLRPFETPCVQVVRKQYGTFEATDHNRSGESDDPPFPFQPSQGINPSDLNTWRWRYWGEQIIGKAILDLSRIRKDDIWNNPSVHRPIQNNAICRKELAWARDDTMPLVMNHYSATLEQALFRSADSRGKDGNGTAYRIERYNKEKNIRTVHEAHGHILEWLSGFVENVGSEEALRLLQHAGNPHAAHVGAYLDPSREPKQETTLHRPRPVQDSSCSFPKILHFIYLSPHLPIDQDPPSEKVSKLVQQWQDMHPTWDVMFWNNSMVRTDFPDLAHLMSNVTTMAWVADMVRYHAIHKYGGVYLDTDFVPFRSLDGLCDIGNFIVCQQPHRRPDESHESNIAMVDRNQCREVINAVMGFHASHPALERMLNVSLTNTRQGIALDPIHPRFRLWYTGPPTWTRAAKMDLSVEVLHPYTFLPCWFREKDHCIAEHFQNDSRVFAMHEWDQSWGR